jgi:iron complex outermembrane recepter protein
MIEETGEIPIDNEFIYEENSTSSNSDVSTIAVDYEKQVKKDSKLEFGAKSIIQKQSTLFKASGQTDDQSELIFLDSRSNDFEFREQIHAVYGTFGTKIEVLGIKAGLRSE